MLIISHNHGKPIEDIKNEEVQIECSMNSTINLSFFIFPGFNNIQYCFEMLEENN